jgi:hypothetical protein
MISVYFYRHIIYGTYRVILKRTICGGYTPGRGVDGDNLTPAVTRTVRPKYQSVIGVNQNRGWIS